MSGQNGHLRLDGRVWRLLVRVASQPGQPRIRRSFRLGTTVELPTKTAARRAADRLLQKVAPRELNAGSLVTWEQWCLIYLERHLVLLSKGTQDTRRSIICKHLLTAPSLAGKAVHEILPADAQDFVTDQTRDGVAPSTVKARFAVLRRLLRAADAAGLTATPPSGNKTTFPRDLVVSSTVRSKAFSPDEVDRILAAAPEPLRTICALCRYAGLRASEALGLRWSAIDLDAAHLEVREQALCGQLRPLKSSSSRAHLPIPALLLAALRAHQAAWVPNDRGLLFAMDDGSPLIAAEIRTQLHELLRTLGIPRRGLHGFRHACALALAGASINPEVIRLAMRHSTLRTTAIYLSATSGDVSLALETASRGAGMARN